MSHVFGLFIQKNCICCENPTKYNYYFQGRRTTVTPWWMFWWYINCCLIQLAPDVLKFLRVCKSSSGENFSFSFTKQLLPAQFFFSCVMTFFLLIKSFLTIWFFFSSTVKSCHVFIIRLIKSISINPSIVFFFLINIKFSNHSSMIFFTFS